MQGEQQGKSPGHGLRLALAVLATSLLHAAAHPPWSLWPLALVATAPVSAVLLDPRAAVGWRRGAAVGFFFGCLVTWAMVAPWSWPAAREYFGGSTLAAAGFTAALPLAASAVALHYAAAFALLARLAGLGAAAGILGSAALWAGAELVRTSVGQGNPWGAFAAALATADAALSGFRAETPVAGLLGLGGPPAVTFVAAATGASLGLAWIHRRSAVERGRALAVGAMVVLAAAAASRAGLACAPLRDEADVPAKPLRVALVQPGFGRSRLWESTGAAESLARHLELTRGFETRGADLIVWPENALPFLMDANADERDALRELARERGAALLLGASRSLPGEDGRTRVFSSAFLFPADGAEPLVYDKRILLPYIENIPAWVAPFLASPWQGSFTPGVSSSQARPVSASGEASSVHYSTPPVFEVKGWRIAPLLCLEAIYPSVAASRAAEGADLLVNLSNDSWFDHGAGPEQHFSLAMLASAETRRPMVRVATTGVSALVTEDGLLSWRMPVRTGAVALLDVVPPRRDSLFVRGGQAGFALFVVLLAAGAALLPVLDQRKADDIPGQDA